MYQDYFGIEESPFSLTPDPRYVYMARGHEEALAHLLYGVSEGGGCVMLSGEVGTGKTSVCRCLMEQLPAGAEVALILNPRLDEIELLANICDELGVERPENATIKALVDRLNQHFLKLHAEGRHAVLIVDEAQNLSREVLEQIRMLTNLETAQRKLLQIILIGQPELDELLNRRDLRQLAQRISARYHLEPLSALETRACIAHRLEVAGLAPTIFDGGACAEVYKRSKGVPRLINSICDRCLLAAYVQDTQSVDRAMARQAATEVFGKRPKSRQRRRAMLPWTLAGATAAVAAAVVLLSGNLWPPGGLPSVSIVIDKPETAREQIGTDGSAIAGSPAPSAPSAPSAGAESAPEAGAPASPAAEGEVAAREALQTAETAPTQTADSDTVPPDDVPEVSAGSAVMVPESEPEAPREVATVEQTAALPPQPVPSAVPSAPGASEPASPGMVELERLLARGDVTGDRDAALARLFALWQRDYGALAGADACQKARNGGLRCLKANGRVTALINLNRPAVLRLKTPAGRQVHAVLIALDGDFLLLQVGETLVRASFIDLSAAWGGDFLVLWQPPTDYRRALKRGQSGPDVAWLKNRLAELRGEPADASDATFDADLEAEVITFQRSHPLLVDGIAGARTIIQLNNAVGGPKVAALQAQP